MKQVALFTAGLLAAAGVATAAYATHKWACPMHPEYVSDEPGKHKVPGCGMDLVPVEHDDESDNSEG